MTTLRYRAESRIPYARALWALTVYAHDHRYEFDYGPLQLKAMEDTGLTVSGPDLEGVRAILEEIPGLYPSDE